MIVLRMGEDISLNVSCDYTLSNGRNYLHPVGLKSGYDKLLQINFEIIIQKIDENILNLLIHLQDTHRLFYRKAERLSLYIYIHICACFEMK